MLSKISFEDINQVLSGLSAQAKVNYRLYKNLKYFLSHNFAIPFLNFRNRSLLFACFIYK